jgi:hypothetical protein
VIAIQVIEVVHLPNLRSVKKANARGKKSDRPNLRTVSKSKFTRIDSMDGLIERLFG